MVESIFTGKVMETKWIHGYMISFGNETEWHIHPQYIGVCYSVGHAQICGREYIRILKRDEINRAELGFELCIGDIYKFDDKVVRVESKVYNSDSTITYHTDLIIENTIIVTHEESEKNRNEYIAKRREESEPKKEEIKKSIFKKLMEKIN